jgi:hypothetical protein
MNNVYIFQYSEPTNCHKSCPELKVLQIQFESILVTLNVKWAKHRNISQAKPWNTIASTAPQELSWALNMLFLILKSLVHKTADLAVLHLIVRYWCYECTHLMMAK